MLGSGVMNDAIIEAPAGSALLAAGETITIGNGPDSLIVTSQGEGSINQRGRVSARDVAYAAEGDIIIAKG